VGALFADITSPHIFAQPISHAVQAVAVDRMTNTMNKGRIAASYIYI
jgi:hypothetical protein